MRNNPSLLLVLFLLSNLLQSYGAELQRFPIKRTNKPVEATHGTPPASTASIHAMMTIHGVLASEAIHFVSKHLSRAIKSTMPPVFVEKSPLLSALISMPACCVIMALYIGIYALWQEVIHKAELRSYLRMHETFTVPYDKEERQKRPHSILLSAFSHKEFCHLAMSLMALHMFGEDLEPYLGTRAFVYLYVCSAYAASLLNFRIFQRIDSFLERAYGSKFEIARRVDLFMGQLTETIQLDKDLLPQSRNAMKKRVGAVAGGLGASGAISGLATYSCLCFPNDRYYFLRVLDLPAPSALLVWCLQDMLQLGRQTGIAHGSHLGGYFFGLLAWLVRQHFRPKGYP